MKKQKVLVFNSHYYPGLNSGGIVRTILNTVNLIGDKIEFNIITSDRDINSNIQYKNIKINKWNKLGFSKVRYLLPSQLSFRNIRNIISESDYNCIHLNSFFDSRFTIKILILNWLGLIKPKFIILSPRGEFIDGPLKIKYLKKFIYITISKFLGFYKNIIWHASLDDEAISISKVMKVDQKKIRLAKDLPISLKSIPKINFPKSSKKLKVLFFSRFTREKNLEGAINIIKSVPVPIQFDIVGFKEDIAYWKSCMDIAKNFQSNINFNIIDGIVDDYEKFKLLSSYDLFLFPSHGENYGHVVAESICVGTKVLLSNNLPAWENLEKDGIGWNFDNRDVQSFVNVIINYSKLSPRERDSLRNKVKIASKYRLFDNKNIKQNIDLYNLN